MNKCDNIKLGLFSKEHYTYINQIFGDLTVREIIKETYAPRDWEFVVEGTDEAYVLDKWENYGYMYFIKEGKCK